MPKKIAKIRGFCIKGRVDNNWNSKKSATIRGIDALRGKWIQIGI